MAATTSTMDAALYADIKFVVDAPRGAQIIGDVGGGDCTFAAGRRKGDAKTQTEHSFRIHRRPGLVRHFGPDDERRTGIQKRLLPIQANYSFIELAILTPTTKAS